jgi:hypothetical protein
MAKYHQGTFKPKNPGKYLGNVNNITYRSSWELKCFMDLDRSPDIIGWASEPIAIGYYDPTTRVNRRYFPDLIVKARQKDGSVVTTMIEIKPSHETIPPTSSKGKTKKRFIKEAMLYGKNTAKWTQAQKFCKERGWVFKLMTEKDLGIVF